jgi:tRNA(Ile)-lysidine synthase
MAREKGIFLRPLLGIDRNTTEEACSELGIDYWNDPHNDDPQFLRVRVRRMMPLIDSEIGPGVVDALARSADLLRDDADALDGYAQEFLLNLDPSDIDIEALARLPRAVRTRVLRLAIYSLGAPGGSLTADHISPVEALVSDWHGQGPTSLPGGVKVERKSGRLSLSRRE